MAYQTAYSAITVPPPIVPPPVGTPFGAPGDAAAIAAAATAAAAAATVAENAGAFYMHLQTVIPDPPFPYTPPPFPVGTLWRDHLADARGKYRIFNDAGYRFYRSDTAPPAEGSEPFATNATLPYTPDDVYADGTWYLACSYFNGVLDSGFLPIGPNGETYLRIDITDGDEIDSPPNAPNHWRLIQRPAGVVRVSGVYFQVGDLRATQWAIAYTTNGAAPATDDPDLTKAMPATGLCHLQYSLPAQAHETVVKVRLQTRRQDGETWYYSEDSTVETITVDMVGPTVPLAGVVYPGVPAEGG